MTNALRKEIASLGSAKGRRHMRAFVAEGTRCVLDMLGSFGCRNLFATARWLEEHPELAYRAEQVAQSDIDRMSQQQSPQPVLAVLEMPEERTWSYTGELALALDAVQDPGNLGTIIRLADWFGIGSILAGPGTADAFQPKVVQATMGALGRVSVCRCANLAEELRRSGAPVAGTFLDGRDLYSASLPLEAGHRPVVVMGNEGSGISDAVSAICSERLLIPSFPPGRPTVESLNVAMATGIIISELTRRIYSNG